MMILTAYHRRMKNNLKWISKKKTKLNFQEDSSSSDDGRYQENEEDFEKPDKQDDDEPKKKSRIINIYNCIQLYIQIQYWKIQYCEIVWDMFG